MTVLPRTDIDFTTALARLLSDSKLRKQFAIDPNKLVSGLSLSKSDKAMMLSLSHGQLELQAKVLLNKRLHEIQTILPNTFSYNKLLLAQEFYRYAEDYWPIGYKKHQLDAIRFCQHLKNKIIYFDPAELNRLKFSSKNQFFAVYFHRNLWNKGQYHFTLQILYRPKITPKELQLYFAF